MNKIYLFILVCCVQSYLLPFSYCLWLRFSLPLIKTTARNRQTANAEKLTKAKDRKLTITAHTLTSVWPSCFLRGQVCCTDYWQQNGIRVTVCFGLNFRTRQHSTFRKKEEKTKFWGRLAESVVFQKTVIESTFDFILWMDYWINKQNHFSVNEFISLLATRMLDLLFDFFVRVFSVSQNCLQWNLF